MIIKQRSNSTVSSGNYPGITSNTNSGNNILKRASSRGNRNKGLPPIHQESWLYSTLMLIFALPMVLVLLMHSSIDTDVQGSTADNAPSQLRKAFQEHRSSHNMANHSNLVNMTDQTGLLSITGYDSSPKNNSQFSSMTSNISSNRTKKKVIRELPKKNMWTRKQRLKRPHDKNLTVYSAARKDRSGAALLSYFMGHAYAHKFGWTYGGICGNTTDHEEQQIELLHDFLGLEKIFPYHACPDDDNDPNSEVLSYFLYTEINGTAILNDEWAEVMRSQLSPSLQADIKERRQQQKQNESASNNRTKRVTVHVRRGDVKPCTPHRYLPNRHYLEILDKYVTDKNVNITIHSDANLGMEDFTKRGYSVDSTSSLPTVWRDMMLSDVFVMSKSDFSYVPALLGVQDSVLYTPFDVRFPLKRWTVVDRAIKNKTDSEDEILCPMLKRRRGH